MSRLEIFQYDKPLLRVLIAMGTVSALVTITLLWLLGYDAFCEKELGKTAMSDPAIVATALLVAGGLFALLFIFMVENLNFFDLDAEEDAVPQRSFCSLAAGILFVLIGVIVFFHIGKRRESFVMFVQYLGFWFAFFVEFFVGVIMRLVKWLAGCAILDEPSPPSESHTGD